MSHVSPSEFGGFHVELDDVDQAVFASGLVFNEEEVGVPVMFAPHAGFPEIKIGDVLEASKDEHLEVVRKLGFGSNSSVWLARSEKGTGYYALRVLSQYATNKFCSPVHESDNIQTELSIQLTIKHHPGIQHIVHVASTFLWHRTDSSKHQCLVSELAGPSIGRIKQYFEAGLPPVSAVRQIARQILYALDFIHTECNLIHTDIKPDNILVVNPLTRSQIDELVIRNPQNWYPKPSTTVCDDIFTRDSDILGTIFCQVHELVSQPLPPPPFRHPDDLIFRLSDFRKAQRLSKHTTDDISTPRLRAPELILGHPWDEKIDIWSFGCTIYEFLTGKHLFKIRPSEIRDMSFEAEHLLVMTMQARNDFPLHMLERSSRARRYFHEDGKEVHKFLDPLHKMETDQPLWSIKAHLWWDVTNGKIIATYWRLTFHLYDQEWAERMWKLPWLLSGVV